MKWRARFGDAISILLFPSDEFGQQELDSKEIGPFVQNTYGLRADSVGCKLMAKVSVNGPDAHPAWQFLKQSFPGEVRWNFASWSVFDREGRAVGRFEMNDFDAVSLVLEKSIRG